jgi:divalent metal cation (Fe/Co/Zn/Cd) transporter
VSLHIEVEGDRTLLEAHEIEIRHDPPTGR